ncbi:MAG: hypothetical protein IIA06_01760 [Proteobacteria bacterium]|nr:hypothetical protein [Pseudomonadota bacterium]
MQQHNSKRIGILTSSILALVLSTPVIADDEDTSDAERLTLVERQENRAERREDRQENRAEHRENHQENRAEHRENHQENRADRRESGRDRSDGNSQRSQRSGRGDGNSQRSQRDGGRRVARNR